MTAELWLLWISVLIYAIGGFAFVDVINHYGVPYKFAKTKKVLSSLRWIAACVAAEVMYYQLTIGTQWQT